MDFLQCGPISSSISNLAETHWMRYTLNPNGGTHALLLRLVPTGSRVLDVGCASGYLGTQLSMRRCAIVGIEIDGRAAAVARDSGAYLEVHEIDLDDDASSLPVGPFDIVLCADVLEHLRDPERVLKRLRPLIAGTGSIVISLPNVAHVSVRARLMAGRFDYAERGILDRTHIHLYTYKSARALGRAAGFRLTAELAGSNRFGNALSFGPWPIRWLRSLLAYNIVLIAQPTHAGETN